MFLRWGLGRWRRLDLQGEFREKQRKVNISTSSASEAMISLRFTLLSTFSIKFEGLQVSG